MFKTSLVTTALLAFLLSACGGGESTIAGNTTTDTDTDTDGGSVLVSEGLGAGVDGAHQPGTLTLSESNVLTGGFISITANGVDKNDNNGSLNNGAYQYTFESICSTASTPVATFSTTVTFSSDGEATTNYFNNGCSGSDVITAKLFNQLDNSVTATPLATATATIQTDDPQLGFGSGVDYRDGLISGELDLVGVTETTLTANAVNTLLLNSLVTSSNYVATWASDCATASFSIPSQTLENSTIQTRYDADLDNCAGENNITLTLTLASNSSTVLDSTTTIVNVSSQSSGGDVVVPSLGTGTDGEFREGELELSVSRIVTGNSSTISSNLVDKNSSNIQLTNAYQYVFTSECANPSIPDGETEAPEATASFTLTNIVNSDGAVSTVYTPFGSACADAGTDTVTLSVYESTATPGADDALAVASSSIQIANPKLGSGSGSSFRAGEIGGEVNGVITLTGSQETLLTADVVDPLDANSTISASDLYRIEWSETVTCPGDTRSDDEKFSVQSQTLSNDIETRYTTGGNAPACTNTEVTVGIYLADGSEILDSMDVSINLQESSTSSAVPDLGVGNGDDFIADQLSLSSTNVLIGAPVTVTVNLVDSDADNALLTERYQFNFSSSCGIDASFSRDSLISGTGTASVTYTALNTNCTSDTISVSLTDLATGTVAGVTASGSVSATHPLLGSGSGAQFRAGEVEGEVSGMITLTGTNETLLIASAVDPQAANSTLSSTLYEVRWTEDTLTPATCTTVGSFSVQTQTLASAIETRYTVGAMAPTCTSTNVTASLYLFGGSDVLDSMSVTVNLEEGSGGAVIDPALGSGSGETFNEGTLALTFEQVLIGSSTLITVNGVDKNDGNDNLSEQYQYTFESICSNADTADFSISKTFSVSNIVSSTYRNRNCNDGDTITVKLFEADADSATATPLSTAEFDIDTDEPLLGNGFGAAYIDDAVSGSLELSGDTTTDLIANAVNPLDSNSIIDDENYIAEWFTDCSTGSFSVEKQDLEGGSIETRYTTDLVNCLGDNNLSLVLYEKTRPSQILDRIDFVVDVQQGVAPDLGTGTDGAFVSGALDINPGSISAAGTALVSINIVDTNDNNTLINNRSYGLIAASLCAEQVPAQASFNVTEQITAQGSVSFTYIASGCVGDDTITITLYDVVSGAIDLTSEIATATGLVTVASAEIGAITYSGTTASSISISTIGDAVLPKQSVLTFAVVDKSNNPVEGQTVEFSLSNSTGGVELASPAEVTDSNGEVSAIVNSGSSHVVTSVVARTQIAGADTDLDTSDDVYIQTSSQPISITTGIADQDSFTISADIFNPGSYNIDGVEVSISVFAADQYQNPVADGTVVNFTAESGFVGSNCLTEGGTCSVTWTSSGVRPGNHLSGLERVNDLDPQESTSVLGMTTITAYTTGEAGYTDQNGNGQFDYIDRNGDDVFSDGDGTEPYLAYAEAFRDDNWNGTLDSNVDGPVEFFADFNEDGEHSPAPSFYQGVVCSTELQDIARLQPNDGVYDAHCKYMMHVQSSLRIIQSYSEAPIISIYTFNSGTNTYSLVNTDDDIDASLGSFFVLLHDRNDNIPATGSSLAVSGDGFDITGDSGVVSNTIGLLYTGTDENLPSFGEIYRIGFAEDGLAVSIEVTGTFGAFSSQVVLDAVDTDGDNVFDAVRLR